MLFFWLKYKVHALSLTEIHFSSLTFIQLSHLSFKVIQFMNFFQFSFKKFPLSMQLTNEKIFLKKKFLT